MNLPSRPAVPSLAFHGHSYPSASRVPGATLRLWRWTGAGGCSGPARGCFASRVLGTEQLRGTTLWGDHPMGFWRVNCPAPIPTGCYDPDKAGCRGSCQRCPRDTHSRVPPNPHGDTGQRIVGWGWMMPWPPSLPRLGSPTTASLLAAQGMVSASDAKELIPTWTLQVADSCSMKVDLQATL